MYPKNKCGINLNIPTYLLQNEVYKKFLSDDQYQKNMLNSKLANIKKSDLIYIPEVSLDANITIKGRTGLTMPRHALKDDAISDSYNQMVPFTASFLAGARTKDLYGFA